MELKKICVSVPSFLPKCGDRGTAYYIDGEETYNRAVFDFCNRHRIRIYNWDPYYKSSRDNYEAFMKEFRWGCDDKIEKPYEMPEGWYMFQKYTHKGTYWSENREQEELYSETRITIDSISAAKEQVEEFLSKFFDEKPAELSYADQLTKLGEDILSDEAMPECVKAASQEYLDRLKELLFKYSA